MRYPRSDDAVDEQLNLAADGLEQGTKWPGMSYEEGVHQALLWVTGQSDEPPMSED